MMKIVSLNLFIEIHVTNLKVIQKKDKFIIN